MPRRAALALACLLVLTPTAPALARDAAPQPVDPATSACPPDRVQSAGFTDVPRGDATALAIDCVAGYGIARGTRSGAYDRSSTVTRGQMALFLDRVTAYALQSTGSTTRRNSSDAGFDDLGGQLPEIVQAVNRLANEGVVRGSDADRNGRFSYRPAERMSRGQMAALLRRSLGSIETLLTGRPSSGPSSSSDYFDDDAGSVFEPDINAVTGAGIAGGFPDGRFGADAPITRQQMALFLARLLEVEVRDGVFPSRYADGGRPVEPPPPSGPAVPGRPTQVAAGCRCRGGSRSCPTAARW
jgi:hypothetical protein